MADINKIIYTCKNIINLNIEKIKKIIIYNLNNHSDYIYAEDKITDIYNKLLLKVPMYIEIFINNLIECMFRTSNIHNKNDIIYNNYIKRFNYIQLINKIGSIDSEYRNHSHFIFNILSTDKNPITISQSFYYNYLFINFINDIYVLPSTSLRLNEKLLHAIYFKYFTTNLLEFNNNYVNKNQIINFNTYYRYNYKLQNENKDLKQDIYKKIYNKYKSEYDTYQKNIKISISKIFLKYFLHL